MMKKILSGISAGVCIGMGGAVFLACENRVVGSVLFAVALLCICMKGFSLFTGKVGYVPENHGWEANSVLLLGLLGNLIGTTVIGLMLRYGLPKLGAAAETLCAAKLDQTWIQTLIRGIFCGVLMYLAVSTYREHKTFIGILFCIPVFILSGFEHSIADALYFAAAGMLDGRVCLFILIVIIGNAIGGMLLPTLSGAWKKAK